MEDSIKEVKKFAFNPQRIHPIKYVIKMYQRNPRFYIASFIWSVVSTVIGLFFFFQLQEKYNSEHAKTKTLNTQLAKVEKSLRDVTGRDEYKINESLKQQFKENHDLLQSTISVYEDMVDLPATDKKLVEFKTRFALVLKYLSDKNNSSASSELKKLDEDIEAERSAQVASIQAMPNTASAPVSNTPPGSGFSRQTVDVNGNKYLVDIVAGNLGSTRIIVDTATDGDCRDNCPVLSLGEYVARNGAYAGINGSYFCPADYPTCAGKTNSFDTLAMNKNKKYINSDNNIYSTVPAAIFGNGFIRFVGASQDWGRDTGVDGVLANQPLMVSGGKSVFGGDGDPKKGGSGTRGFVANKGSTAYIGFVHNASVANAALVLEKMGMDNALNLDSGGSVALWANGRYQVGPGRSIPNAILFVNK
ncbi:MAG TPA: phosphodiester glycosidase family protein [Candidatus Levybacteria bacterium]|nr:phosphodiester glycosidase family protein [Candidatus Levybacteria bacterium]